MFALSPAHTDLLMCDVSSDVKSRVSVLSQDSLESQFGCLGLGLVGWCRCLEHQLKQFNLYFLYPTEKCITCLLIYRFRLAMNFSTSQ